MGSGMVLLGRRVEIELKLSGKNSPGIKVKMISRFGVGIRKCSRSLSFLWTFTHVIRGLIDVTSGLITLLSTELDSAAGILRLVPLVESVTGS